MRIIKDVVQGSEEWLALRLGKITGTRLKSVLVDKDSPALIYELVAEMLNPVIEESYTSAEMQRGSDLEPVARRAYEEYSGLKVDQVGFVLNSKYDYCGYSPDGLIKIGGAYKKSLEMKCPATKTHVEYIVQGGIPKKYDSQILSAFYNCPTVETVVFVSYDDRCVQKPLHVVEVTRDQYQKQIELLDEKLPAFWKKVQDYHMQVVF